MAWRLFGCFWVVSVFALAAEPMIKKSIETFDKGFWDDSKKKEEPKTSTSDRSGQKRAIANSPRYSEKENRAREDSCGSLKESDFNAYKACSQRVRQEQLDARERNIDKIEDRQKVPLEYVPEDRLPEKPKLEKGQQE